MHGLLSNGLTARYRASIRSRWIATAVTVAAGVVAVDGEPTSVAVTGPYALVGVNTSPSFLTPSGQLKVVDIAARLIVQAFDLGGQPDSVAVSPDHQYAAIAIENERNIHRPHNTSTVHLIALRLITARTKGMID